MVGARRVEEGLPAALGQREPALVRLGIDEQQQRRGALAGRADQRGERTRRGVVPVVAGERSTVVAQPAEVAQPGGVRHAAVPAVGQRQQSAANRDHAGRERDQGLVGLGPVGPRGRVVLAVRILVAAGIAITIFG